MSRFYQLFCAMMHRMEALAGTDDASGLHRLRINRADNHRKPCLSKIRPPALYSPISSAGPASCHGRCAVSSSKLARQPSSDFADDDVSPVSIRRFVKQALLVLDDLTSFWSIYPEPRLPFARAARFDEMQ